MRFNNRRLLSILLSRSEWWRNMAIQNPRPNPPSSLLTHQLNVQPKVFERELWYIFDNLDRYPWISREELVDIKQKIFDLKKMKKELNPVLYKQRELKEAVAKLTLEREGNMNEGTAEPEMTRLTEALEEVSREATPRVAALEAIEGDIFDRVVFFPNCRPSEATGEEDRVILSGGERRHFPFALKSHADMDSQIVFKSDVGPPSSYYLLDDAVEAEFALVDRFEDALLEADFFPFGSMPDIVSAPPVIACGSTPDDLIPISASSTTTTTTTTSGEDDDDDDEASGGSNGKRGKIPRFLTGGSSHFTFAAFFSQLMFRTGRANTGIPLRLFSIGRNYRFVEFRRYRHPSLFNCLQSTRLSLFGVPHLQKPDELFDDYSQFLAWTYAELGLPFQMVEVGKDDLNKSESRRQDIRVWSPVEERYVVCASVSHHNDYIANRLLSFQRRSETHPCQFISGVAADVAVLLGAAMENGQREDGSWTWPGINE